MAANATVHTAGRVNRKPRVEWVPVARMRVSPVAQRDLRQSFVDEIAASFDPDRIGYPVVSKHDNGEYFIVDGQHRIASVRAMGWEDQSVECEVYYHLTEQQEADLFLWLNRRLNVRPFDLYRIGVVADRGEETEIDRIVRAQGLRVSQDSLEGSICAVGALREVYRLGGEPLLGRTLRVLRDSFGVYRGEFIRGLGMFFARYDGEQLAAEEPVADKLGRLTNGARGVTIKANILRQMTGRPVAHCVAGAVVEIVNSGKGGRKLASWWQ